MLLGGKSNKNKKWWFLTTRSLVILLALFTIAASTPAQAAFDLETSNDCGFGEMICAVQVGIQNLIIMLFLGIGKLWAFLLQLVTKGTIFLISYGTSLAANPAVSEGFGATLKLTNLIFVLAIIIIAFSTILRYENYSAKKMLPKLIIAALLVNFSLLIGGLLLDASNVLTHYFLEGGVNAEGIGDAFNPQRLLVTPNNPDHPGTVFLDEGDDWGLFLKILLAISIAIIMTAIMVAVMAWVMLMVLVRNIWIAFLLILMPLIWGLWVLPFFQEHWSKWWKNFIQWTIFLPSITFFLWLAVNTATNSAFIAGVNSRTGADLNFASQAGSFIQGAANESIFSLIIRMLIVLGLIVGGLKTGKAFGIIGAAAMMTGIGLVGKFAARAIPGMLGKATTLPLSGTAAAIGALTGEQRQRFANAKRLGSKFFGVGRSIKTSVGFLADKTATTTQVPTGEVIDALGTNRMKDERKDNKFFGGARKFVESFGKNNLYGKATEWASQKLANSPMLAPIAQFLGRMSASQRADAEARLKQADGLSKEAKKNLIAGWLKDGATGMLAAALLADRDHLHSALPHDSNGIKELSETIAAFNPGVKREDRGDIDLLKNIAMHDPSHAMDVIGKSTEDIVKSATAGAIQSWDKGVYENVKKYMSTSARRTWAGRDTEAQDIVFAEEVGKFAAAVNKMEEGERTKHGINPELIAKLDTVAKGGASRADIAQIEGQLDRLGDIKEFKNLLDPDGRGALNLANDVRRIVIRTKTDSGHGEHPSADYQLSTMLMKFLKNVSPSGGGGKSGGGGGGHAPSHGGGGHGH